MRPSPWQRLLRGASELRRAAGQRGLGPRRCAHFPAGTLDSGGGIVPDVVSRMLQVPPLLAVAYALLGSVLPSLAASTLGGRGAWTDALADEKGSTGNGT